MKKLLILGLFISGTMVLPDCAYLKARINRFRKYKDSGTHKENYYWIAVHNYRYGPDQCGIYN
jgi:hypothetical protein